MDINTAKSQNLTYASSDHFVLRADSKTTLSPSGLGRNSVRLSSNKQWGTSVLVADIRHMPQVSTTMASCTFLIYVFTSSFRVVGEFGTALRDARTLSELLYLSKEPGRLFGR